VAARKPRRKGIPAYTHHKPSGQARVNGTDHNLGPYGTPESKAEYERIVRRALADRIRAELARSVGTATDITV
jgi:hypothetical protein